VFRWWPHNICKGWTATWIKNLEFTKLTSFEFCMKCLSTSYDFACSANLVIILLIALCTSATGVSAGVQEVQAHLQRFWFSGNPGKMFQNPGKKLHKSPEYMSKSGDQLLWYENKWRRKSHAERFLEVSFFRVSLGEFGQKFFAPLQKFACSYTYATG